MTSNLEFPRFKQEINLTQYAASLGYEIDRRKSTRQSIAMRKGNEDKIIISRQNGNWVYFSVYDDNDNGTIIDFAKNRTNKSLFEIGRELQVWIGGNINLPEPTRYVSDVQEKQPDPRRIRRLFNYCSPAYDHEYLNSRGITAETLTSPRFSRRVFQDRFRNAVFPHFKGKQICGLELKGKNADFFVRGSEKTLWRSNTRRNDDTLIISETPIDALSYQILHSLDNAFYAATSGGFSPQLAGCLSKLFDNITRIKKVILITDNDGGGDTLTTKLTEIINQSKFSGTIDRCSPDTRGLDWNDVLKKQLGL